MDGMPAENRISGVFASHTAGIDVNRLCGETTTKTVTFPVSVRDFRESWICVYTETAILIRPLEKLGRKSAFQPTLRLVFVIFTMEQREFEQNPPLIKEFVCRHPA